MRLGIIGYNAGNGHPFSFSAIVNGYSEPALIRAGWTVINDYLRQRDSGEFGFGDVRVSHAWTQDSVITRQLCEACGIETAVDNPEQMIGHVDGILLCRHDYETHLEMARPFLQAGLPVFIDKPLSLNVDELREFRPYLDRGKLMSCSGLRYARELDEARASLDAFGSIRLVRAAVVLDWERYGVHMIDAALGLGWANPMTVRKLAGMHDSFAIEMDDGSIMQIDALGAVPKVFRMDIYGTSRETSVQLFDNFSAFRRTIGHFIEMIKTARPPFPVEMTMTSMRTLMAGQISKRENRSVHLNEIVI